MSVSYAYLLETQPYDPVAGTTKNVFFASGLPDDASLAQTTPYFLRLKQAYSHETSVFDQNIPGGTQVSVGSSTINNADGLLDFLLTYAWDGRAVTVKRGLAGLPYATYTTEFVGSALEMTADGTDLVLTIRDNSWKLAKPLQTNVYLGNGGKEGGLDLKQRRKPLLFGSARNLTPVPVDGVRLIAQVHDGAVASISKVYDRGVPLTLYGDAASYSVLANATVPPGSYATCLAEGFFKLGAKNVGTLTVDAVGAYSTATTLPDLARQILLNQGGLTTGDIDSASFDVAATDAPYGYEGLHLQQPDAQIDETLETLVSAFNGFWYLNKLGKFCLRVFKFNTPAWTVRPEDITSLQRQASPNELYRVKTDWGKNPTVQEAGDFVLPKQTLNGYLKDYVKYIATASDGTGGVYSGYTGEFSVFLNRTKVNDLAQVQFTNSTPTATWLTVLPDGTYTITDPGVDSAVATITASLGEFTLSENFTVKKSKGASPKNMVLTTDLDHFYYDQANIPSPGVQTATITATVTNTSSPLTFSAVDSLGNSVALSGTGNTRQLPIANIINSILVSWVYITVLAPDGTVDYLRINVTHGDDGYSAGILGALAAANSAVDIFYQTAPPTGAQTDDLWFDTDDGNKLYRWNGTTWVLTSDTRIADALTNAAGAQATADGKITTYFTETTPTIAIYPKLAVGDLWYRPSLKTLSRWDGSSWSNYVATYGATAGANLFNNGGTILNDFNVDNQYNQTLAASLFYNPSFDLVDPSGKALGVWTYNGTTNTLDQTLQDWDVGAKGGDLLIGTGAAQVKAYLPIWKVNPKSKYRVRAEVKAQNSGALMYVRMNELDTELTSGALYLVGAGSPSAGGVLATRERTGGSTALSGGTSIENSSGLTTSYQLIDIILTPTSTAKYMNVEIFKWSNSTNTGLVFRSLRVEELSPTTLAELDLPASTSVTNFNSRNDRLATTPVTPTLPGLGDTLDHVINTDGSADISFEWLWSGTEVDIDGFQILMYNSVSSGAYTIGTTPAAETVVNVPANKRALFAYGVAANLYYTFAVRAYRVVDPDVNATGLLYSSWVKSAFAGEDPYQPTSAVAFAGNVTGTVSGSSAAYVASAAVNFNNRNDRLATPVPSASFLEFDDIDHTLNTDGSANVSLEWAWPGDQNTIDGFVVTVRQGTTSTGRTGAVAVATKEFF